MALSTSTVVGGRALDTEDVVRLFGPQPAPVLEDLARRLEKHPDVTVPRESLPSALAELLRASAAEGWLGLLEATQPAAAVMAAAGVNAANLAYPYRWFQFAKCPAGATTEDPAAMPGARVTNEYSSWLAVPNSEALRTAGNKALLAFAAEALPGRLPDEPEARAREIRRQIALFNAIAHAALSNPIVQWLPTTRYLPAAPGAVPAAVGEAATRLIKQLRPSDVISTPRAQVLAWLNGFSPFVSDDGPDLLEILPDLTGIGDRVAAEIGDVLKEAGESLGAGQEASWWLEGAGLGSTRMLERTDLRKTSSGMHVLIPPLLYDPPGGPINPTPGIPSIPRAMALSISDLHLGQGADVDNADDVYSEIEQAYVATIGAFAQRVNDARAQYGRLPAYLVLNGDILDFWSADLVPAPGGANPWRSDARLTADGPRVSPQSAGERMQRIWDAHLMFFNTIRDWIASDGFNFLVYVCGNHDDHLNRFGLGEPLAKKFHPSRAVFAARSATILLLRATFEHGHRGDGFNDIRTGGIPGPTANLGSFGTLGELVVSMVVNPFERGGYGAIESIFAENPSFAQNWLNFTFPSITASAGLSSSDLEDVLDVHAHLRQCQAVDRRCYERWAGCVDNVTSEAKTSAVADLTGRELARRQFVRADVAEVEDLDEDLEKLQSTWIANELQSFLLRFFLPKARALTNWNPEIQASMASLVKGSQADRLGFDPQTGLAGSEFTRVHVVGHTHQWLETVPRIEGRIVPYQHINTGTGQDTYEAEDDVLPLDGTTAGVRSSTDRITGVQASYFCLLSFDYAAPGGLKIKVEAGHYRDRAPDDPTRRGGLGGGLRVDGCNWVDLS